MKLFSKKETISIIVIFLVLVAISMPNFIVSLRRARDQVRRDDMGRLQSALADYEADFGTFPMSTSDGRIIACKAPNAKVQIDKNGRINIDLIPCEWGRDSFTDLTPGSKKVYMGTLPSDPQENQGVKYLYSSDGIRYQILSSMEGTDEPEYDKTIVAREVMCGSRVCNMGRAFGCPINMSIEDYKIYLEKQRELQDAQKAKNAQIKK